MFLGFGYNSLILCQLGFLAIAFILLFFLKYQDKPEESKGVKIKPVLNSINGKMLPLFLLIIISSFAFFIFNNSLQPILKEFNFKDWQFPIIIGGFQLAIGIAGSFSNKLSFLGRNFVFLGPFLFLLIILPTNNKLLFFIALVSLILGRGLFFHYYEKFCKKIDRKILSTAVSFISCASYIGILSFDFILGFLTQTISLKISLIITVSTLTPLFLFYLRKTYNTD